MHNLLKHQILATLLLGCIAISLSNAQQNVSLRQQFLHPSDQAKPWTFWYWMYGAVSEEAIRADLQAMKQAGLAGAYLMPIRGIDEQKQYNGTAQQLSPQWWHMANVSMHEADRLGLKLGMHICDGFALAGGPWILPQESMQKVVWTDTIVDGGKLRGIGLPRPEASNNYYEDIALYALPVVDTVAEQTPIVTCVDIHTQANADPKKCVNMDASGTIRASYPCYIQYQYSQPFICRNIEIILNGNNYQAHRLKVMASDDGVNYRFVKQLIPARHGWQNTDQNSTHAIPATTAKYFRLYWTPDGSEPGSEDLDAAKWRPNLKIKQIRLHSQPRLNQWEGKAAFVWRVAHATTVGEIPNNDCYQLSQIINLTKQYRTSDNQLTATLPKGKWRLLRIGHTSTGHTNATAGGGKGLECDKFSATAVRKQFDNWFAKAFSMTDTDVARRVLKYMHVDSWECGSQNWSTNFAAEFKHRRGYDLMPYLPIMAGIPIESAQRSEAILRDVRTTIAELVVDVFYQVLADCAKEYNCQFSAECVAPTMVSDGMLHYQKVDLPMGEFWLNSPTHDKPNDMLDAISGAHIYGKNIIQAEGFTQLRTTWNEHPAMLKALLDRNYALGINRLFYHVFVHNPWLNRKPGMTLDGIGLYFQRNQTWWNQGAKALSQYAARCQSLLQYGHPVTDIAVFTGEEIPRRAVLPERLVPSLQGLVTTHCLQLEHRMRTNVGQPLKTRPVGVTYSANMADPQDWVNPLRGYSYDSFNKDALLRLAKVENGRLTLPGGASYKVFVVPLARPMNPEPTMSAPVQAKISELKAGGVVVPTLPYLSSDFSAYGLEPDIVVPQDIAWTHRHGELADIYFIANQQDQPRTFVASMRIKGKPECWNPQTSEIDTRPNYTINGNRTDVEITLAPYESLFVVFNANDSGIAQAQSRQHTKSTKDVGLITSDFNIHFVENGKNITQNALFDWSTSADEQIRYYSGTAIYSSTFNWETATTDVEHIYMNLGKVYNIATVRINGTDCGTVWTAPYRADISKALKQGINTLEIEVTNTWANAIKGADEGHPPFDGIWTNAKYRSAENILLPAGLVGPLSITIVAE